MKNLNRMGKVTEDSSQPANGIGATGSSAGKQQQQRYHRRTASGSLLTAMTTAASSSTSPRAGVGVVRRNTSTVSMLKYNTSQTRLKKNLSSGQLVRAHGSARNMARISGKDGGAIAGNAAGSSKRRSLPALGKPLKERQAERISPSSLQAPHAVVRFDIGDDEEGDNGEDVWTESSASQSPAVTRSNSRASPQRPGEGVRTDASDGGEERIRSSDTITTTSSDAAGAEQAEGRNPSGVSLEAGRRLPQQADGSDASQNSTQEDQDDMLTSLSSRRFLNDDNRHPTVSSMSGTVVAGGASTLSRGTLAGIRVSQGSTLVEHTGADLVSRFIHEPESAATSHDAAYMRLAPEMRRRDEAGSHETAEAAAAAAGSNSNSNSNSEGSNGNDSVRGSRSEHSMANGMSIDTRHDRRNNPTPNLNRGASSAESSFGSNRSDADNDDASARRGGDPSSVPELGSAPSGSPAASRKKPSRSSNSRTGVAAASSSSSSKTNVVDPLLLPSRTQQKLWLQRASSKMEPGSVVPATLPRSTSIVIGAGAHHFVPPIAVGGIGGGGGGGGSGGKCRIDPRLQRQFDQTEAEYRVVRRFRSPVAEAVARLQAGKHLSFSYSLKAGSQGIGANGPDGHGWERTERETLSNGHGVHASSRSANAVSSGGDAGSSNRNGTRPGTSHPHSERDRQQQQNSQGREARSSGPAGQSRATGRRARFSMDIAPGSLERSDEDVRNGLGGNGNGNGNGVAERDYAGNKDEDGGDDRDNDADALPTFGGEDVERDRAGGESGRNDGDGVRISSNGVGDRCRLEAEEICRRLWDSVQVLGED